MSHPWLAQRLGRFETSGIRRVFDLARSLTSPIDLSIGQPDFDVPPAVQEAAIDAIKSRKNGYTPTQGIPELREKLRARVREVYPHPDRELLVTSGTSGALVLAILALVDPGDEVIVFDPYFVMYPALVSLAGGRCVFVDTYPDFRIDVAKVELALTPRTKVILFNSPCNPTGALAAAAEVRALAELAARRDVALVSDEIYREFCYGAKFASPAAHNPQTLVIDGFSKSHAVTGWRLGYAHGPAAVIEAMQKLQQYTFVCAPQPAQWAGLAALKVDMSSAVAEYRRKCDKLSRALARHFELAAPGGAFYMFPKAPWGTGTEFVEAAVARQLLLIPGSVFSGRDTHFRLSYAASDETLDRGIEVLCDLAKSGPGGGRGR
jgi:aspartate aminotransferase/aminotransferase